MTEPEDPLGAIRTRIIRGEYGPRQRLQEKELAEELGTSRFLVRSALLQLAGEGFIELAKNRGARVREFTVDEALELADLRKAIEGQVAARAAERISDAEVADLRALGVAMDDAVRATDIELYARLSDDLHRCLLEISRYSTAPRFLEQVNPHMLRRQFGWGVSSNVVVKLHEHLEIIDAVCQRDPAAAETTMRRHVEGSRERLLALR